MKNIILACANIQFLTAWAVIGNPLTWIFILGGFGCLTAYVMLLALDVCDKCRKAK